MTVSPPTPPSSRPGRVNVLILGETANGKSTLVKQLGVYGGSPNLEIEIGSGDESCTKTVGSHPLSTDLRSYYLNDRRGGRLKDVDLSEAIDFTSDDAVLAANEPDDDGVMIDFNLFDTPGLDDSEGKDMEIMADIIGRVGELPHLNAVIYVRSMDKPFGPAFNKVYDYLQRCLPMLFGGLIIVHSRYTIDAVLEARTAGRGDLAEIRRTGFQAATKERNHAAHVFMDNDPDTSNPYAVMKSFNACHSLLRLLSTQLPLDISTMKLLKAPNMAALDAQVLLRLAKVQTHIKETIEERMRAASHAKTQLLRCNRELLRLQTNHAECEARVAELDTPGEIVLGTKSVAEDYTLETLLGESRLWLNKRVVHFDADSLITRVVKASSGGCRWLDEDLRGTAWRATLSSSILRSMHGSVTVYTTSQIRHAGEIAELRGRVKDLAQSITYQENVAADLAGSENNKLGADVERLAADEERLTATMENIRRDTFDVTLWSRVRRYYLSTTPPSDADVVDLVAVYDGETARVMRSMRA